MSLAVLMLAAVPAWVWATLIMVAFAALTILTMWLARIPTQGPPRGEGEQEESREGGIEAGPDAE